MQIVDCSLEKTLEHLCQVTSSDFPADHAGNSYWTRYSEMASKLNRDFHSNVVAGNSAVDGALLTDHGIDHIKTVMSRAAAMLDNGKNSSCLTGYEIYLLLCSIHFHDLGNMLGREGHEKRVAEMMDSVGSYLGDSIEKKQIRQIAETHGGKIDGDRDTISFLPPKITVFGKDIRPRLLAAILRFADELADDSYRASRVMQNLKAIPKRSIIYHKYASTLHSVNLRDECQTVVLNFEIDVNDLITKFPKFDLGTKRFRRVYLIDEILDRTLKMYLERTYCNRFMAPTVHIQSISVLIQTSKKNETIADDLPRINFRLEERGYPEKPEQKIYEFSSELREWGDAKKELTGKRFAGFLKSEKVVE